MNPEHPQPTSIPVLLRELRDETTTLLRQEVALAKTELKENAGRMGGHAVQIAIGAFVAYAGVIVLLIGLGQLIGVALVRAGADPDLAPWLASAGVGLLVALIGGIMLTRAKHAIAHDPLAPRETVASLRANKQWVQSTLSPS
jgi:hypothetical protein